MVRCAIVFLQIFILLLTVVSEIICKKSRDKWLSRVKMDTPEHLLEDADLETDELIKKYKYPGEKHFITTEDGYILGLHRIARQGAQPFLLVHGILDSSATYVLMGPASGLAYYLWDQGYDVWLGNVRGNRYSRNHTRLDPDKSLFWDFSFNEMGYYDIPAMIDYVLGKTGFKELFYVGHSQGTTSFFVMCSRRPEYNKKIILMHAMAPVAYVANMKPGFLRALDLFFTSPVGGMFQEVLPKNLFFRYACIHETQIEVMCVELLFMLMGRNYDNFNMTMFPVIMGHIPVGASLKQLRHYLQLYHSKSFNEYDYGLIGNMQKYRSATPPAYYLSKVTAPVVMYFSDNDLIADPEDCDRASRELKNVVGKFRVPKPQWNHIDFIWGTEARSLVYNLILNSTKSFECCRGREFCNENI